MAHNSFRPMYGDEHFAEYKELNTKDLAVGDKLIHVTVDGGNWGSIITRREEEVTVTKVLASRLVVTNAAGKSFRVLVQNSKTYGYGNGRVSTDLEGNSTSYRRAGFYLYTPNDPFLISSRENTEARNAGIRVRLAAGQATEAFTRDRNIKNAEAAIEALQAFIDATKEN